MILEGSKGKLRRGLTLSPKKRYLLKNVVPINKKSLELTETSVLSLTHRPICSAEKPCLKNDKSKL